jgi:hypothetical protein
MIEMQELLRLRRSDDATGLQENDAGGEQQRFAKIVGDENDGFAEATDKTTELALEFGTGDGIEGAKGFVHQ